jgi:hypothetical protein
LTYATCVPLVVLPILLCYQGCNRGDYECTREHFPYVSTTLGVFPNDKIYVFLMQLFTAVQFCTYRAYYSKLSTLTSPLVNSFLFLCGMICCVAGPVLALFDHTTKNNPPTDRDRIGMDIHINATGIFVVCQVLYLFIFVQILNGNQEKFKNFST